MTCLDIIGLAFGIVGLTGLLILIARNDWDAVSIFFKD